MCPPPVHTFDGELLLLCLLGTSTPVVGPSHLAPSSHPQGAEQEVRYQLAYGDVYEVDYSIGKAPLLSIFRLRRVATQINKITQRADLEDAMTACR